jgi:signal transduction histidine kinase
LFLASMIVLAVAGPLGRSIMSQARSALTPADPVAEALMQISGRLPAAESREAIQRVIEDGRSMLPEDVRLDIYLRRPNQNRFHLAFRWGGNERLDASPVPVDAALPRLLREEGSPLTRRYVAREAQEARGDLRRLAWEAHEQLSALDLRLVVPLSGDDPVAGWIGVGGGLSDRYLTSEVAMAFLAVGNQATACLDRIEALEVARRKENLAAVGELAAGLAHEVRNPVAAIRGASQAMGPEATGEQRREMLDVIEEETERLGRVVGEFLDYARPGEPRRDRVDLAELARRVRKGAELSGRQLEFELTVDPDAPPALGDVDRLHRAFENLVRNAWEAAGEGGTLRVEVYSENAGRVAVRFEDNGPGIPAREVERLFQPFHSTKRGGTGLGLALVHRIVEAHGGELRVEGRPGVGAVLGANGRSA